jgi:capsular exopolysaccharide synthesis family protein
MELRQQLRVLRSRWWLLVASILITGAAAFLVSTSLPKVYEARATLLVGQSVQASNPDLNQLLASQRLSQTYADLAQTDPLLERVIATTGAATTPQEFRKRITAAAPRDSILVHLTVEDANPQRAAQLANALAAEVRAASPAISGLDSQVQQFIDEDLVATQAQIRDTQSEIQRLANLASRSSEEEQQLERLQGRIVSLRQTYATILGFSSSGGANLLTIVDPASPPLEASSPRPLLNTLVAAVVGLLVALALVYVREYLDDSVKSADDVEAVLRLPTLGTIARMKGGKDRGEMYRLVTLLYPRSPPAEAFRSLRSNTEFASVDAPVKTVLITSSIPGEGKTTTAANLAVAMAQAGSRTILLDADFRKPGIHKVFNLANVVGLSALLRRDGASPGDVVQETEQDNLRIITTGPLPPNPAELLRSKRMSAILEELSITADFVVIDSPPVQAVTDAAILASMADGTLFVVDAGRTHQGTILSALDGLAKAGARVLGVVLNRIDAAASYAYDYYGAYGDGPAESGVQAAPQASQQPH